MAQSDRSKVRKRRILKIGHKTRVFIPKKIRQLKNIILGVFFLFNCRENYFLGNKMEIQVNNSNKRIE